MASISFLDLARSPGYSPMRVREKRPRPTVMTWQKNMRLASLTLQVHGYAFCSAPILYLEGVMWRARGLRVRSRNRIAALMGRSPKAYSLWIERNSPTSLYAVAGETCSYEFHKIWPIIDCRSGMVGIERTLASLKRSGIATEPLVIGGGQGQVQTPRELASFIAEPKA